MQYSELQSKVADYEAMVDRLNQQVSQLRSERSQLGGDVDRLTAELDKARQALARSPGQPQAIDRDWKTEEIERLNREVGFQTHSFQQKFTALHG